jgi:phosphoribosyl-AMP cyclohydrolase
MQIVIDFSKGGGLIPVIVQDNDTDVVLMLGYMDQDAFNKTLETGYVYFWSRSRKKLWLKGEESGNKFRVASITTDCDSDAILVKIKLIGSAACHTGNYSCFSNNVWKGEL